MALPPASSQCSAGACLLLPHRGATIDKLLHKQKSWRQDRQRWPCRLPLLSVRQELVYCCHTEGQLLTSSCTNRRVGARQAEMALPPASSHCSAGACLLLPHRGATIDKLLHKQKSWRQDRQRWPCRLPLLSVRQELVYCCHTEGQLLTSSCTNRRVGDKTGRGGLATCLFSLFCRSLSIAATQRATIDKLLHKQ